MTTETINKFVIPKKQSSDFQLQSLDTESTDVDKEVIEKSIKQSCFDRLCVKHGYKRVEFKKVTNKQIEDQYTEALKQASLKLKKSKLKSQLAKNESNSLYRKTFFYAVQDEKTMLQICKNGFECKKSDEDDDNVLGSSEYGIHLSKHFDVSMLYQYSKKVKSFYLIIVKGFFSKFRLTHANPQKHRDSYPDPIEGVEHAVNLPEHEFPIRTRYHNSLVYMFDADDQEDILNKPRNLLPWAVLKFEMDLSYSYDKNIYQSKQATHAQQKIINNQMKNFKFRSIKLNPLNSHQTNNNNNNHPTINLDFADESAIIQKEPVVRVPPSLMSFQTRPTSNISLNHCELSIEKVIEPEKIIEKKVEEESEEDEEDMGEFWYKYYIEQFSGLVEELYMKPARWRIVYERTGRLDVKFKGAKKLEIKLDDVHNSKLKFLDSNKTKLNLKDPTNNLILTYQNKRLRNQNTKNTDITLTNVLETSKKPKLLIKPTSSKMPTQKVAPKQPIVQKATKSISKEKLVEDLQKKMNELKEKKAAQSSNLVKKTEKQEPEETKKPINTGLSSELTSLEKRLLAKSSLISSTKTTSTEKQDSNVLRENFQKLLTEMNKNKPTPTQNESNSNCAPNSKSLKRKKSFWEPDSDTEYDKLRKAKNDDDIQDDIVLVTRTSLPNVPTMQYSKQFYDLNINGFEIELKKFLKLNNNINITTNILSMTKSPIKSSKEPTQASSSSSTTTTISTNKPLSRRERYLNKPKFIHYLKTKNLISEFDVENLKNLGKNEGNEKTKCIEIHSGGFGCIIEQESKQLRRTQSFSQTTNIPISLSSSVLQPSHSMQNLTLDTSISNNKNKISLTDYVQSRVKPQQSQQQQQQQQESQSNTTQETIVSSPKAKVISPVQTTNSNSLPVIGQTSKQSTSLPSLSLIDELKKRIQQKGAIKKEPETKEEPEEGEEEEEEIERENVLKSTKRKSKHKKKSKSKRKKIESKSSHKKHKKHKLPKKSASKSSISMSSTSLDLSSSSSYDSLILSPNLISSDVSLDSSLSSSSSSSCLSVYSASSSSKKKSSKRKKDQEEGELNDDDFLLTEHSRSSKKSSHKSKHHHNHKKIDYDLTYDFDLNLASSASLPNEPQTPVILNNSTNEIYSAHFEKTIEPDNEFIESILNETKKEQEQISNIKPEIEKPKFQVQAIKKPISQSCTSTPIQNSLERYHAIMKIGTNTPTNQTNRSFQANKFNNVQGIMGAYDTNNSFQAFNTFKNQYQTNSSFSRNQNRNNNTYSNQQQRTYNSQTVNFRFPKYQNNNQSNQNQKKKQARAGRGWRNCRLDHLIN